ncbi:MAG: O-antigen ligase family protein [Bacteroidia bacterium]|nr:O-antigen ligase family protein [Bacteroidia bacterium]
MTEQLNKKIHVVLTTILAFLIPSFPNVLPVLIVLLALNWLIYYKNIKISFQNIRKNTALLFMLLLYVAYLVGLLYTSNFKFAAEILETKFSFLLLPLVYSAYMHETSEKLDHYLLAFVYGCVGYALFCFGYAFYAFYKPVYTDLYGVLYDLGYNYFYYSYLSSIFHPSYASMYAVIALLAIYYLNRKSIVQFNLKWVSIVVLLSVYTLFLSSKAGWIGLFLVFLVYLFELFRQSKYLLILFVVIGLSTLFYVINVRFAPTYAQRIPKVETIENAIKEKDEQNNAVTTSSDGTGSRIFVWKASVDVINENLLFGVGTGDSRDKMLEKYLEKQMKTEYEFGLNSHNQFLNTAVSIGLLGLLLLLACFIVPFFKALRVKNILVIGFVVLVSMNLLFESMFERQAGVIFYVFLNTLLCSTFVSGKLKN